MSHMDFPQCGRRKLEYKLDEHPRVGLSAVVLHDYSKLLRSWDREPTSIAQRPPEHIFQGDWQLNDKWMTRAHSFART